MNIIYHLRHCSALNIRGYVHEDLSTLSRIERKTFGIAAYNKRMLRSALEHPLAVSLVAEDRGQILGYICAIPISQETMDIESFAVEPRSQNSGTGSLLFDELEQEILRTGYTEIILEVRESNTNAIQFYRNRGFKVSEYLPSYYKVAIDGTRNAYRMVKYLDL